MPPTGTKKRKAGDVGGPEGRGGRQSSKRKTDTHSQTPSATSAPQLPAPVWGHVLDYMPYQGIRSALLIGKLIAVEATKHVTTLNIMRSCEMNVRAARRFSNVKNLHVLCLLEPTGDREYGSDRVILSTDTAMCLVPLASAFPKLETLDAGCIVYDEDMDEDVVTRYFEDDCVGPDNHTELMQGLIGSFCVMLR